MGAEKDNVDKIHADATTSVEIEAHPEEVANVDPETLAITKARLGGIEFDELYGDNDAFAQLLEVKRQRKKLASVFKCLADLKNGFLEGKLKPEVLRELRYEGFEPSIIWPEITNIGEISFEDIEGILNFKKGGL